MSAPTSTPASTRIVSLTASALPLVALAYVYFETAALATRWNWSACRLAPAIALFHGYPLYSAAETGPINGWLYGPVPALAWTPAALASTPLAALGIAATINLLFILAPLLFAVRNPDRNAPAIDLLSLSAFAFGASALLTIYPTWYMVSALNGDFSAVGLGLAACVILIGGSDAPDRKRLYLAAALTVLAAWSKQIEAPLLLAQTVWLAARHSLPVAGRFLIAVGVVGLVISTVFLAGFGPAALLYNMWTIPSHHAFLGGRAAMMAEASDFFVYTRWFWVICVVATVVVARLSSSANRRAWLAKQPWLLPALAALVLLPGGALATIKIGGDRNSIHSAYYIIAASAIALAHIGRQLVLRAPRLIPTALFVIACTPLVAAVRLVTAYPQRAELPPRSLSPEAFDFSRQHPSEAYFPWDPLATLLTEGRLYHFEYGIRDRLYAGVTPSPAQIASGLPPQVRYVIYPRTNAPRVMLDQFLPGFKLIASPDGWLMYFRPVPPSPATAH
jgi:hypothetical protein